MSSKPEGFFPSSRRVYVSGNLNPNIRVPFREITLTPTHVADGTIEESKQFKEQGHQLHISSDATKDEDTEAAD